MSATTDLIDQLNAYRGDNIWEDVIHGIGFNEAATEDIDGGGMSDRFVTLTGEIIRYDGQTEQWYEAGEYDGAADSTEQEYYADVTTGARLSVLTAATDERLVSFKGYDGYDFDWNDPDAAEQRRATITEALAEIGWEPIPGEEWVDIEGGLPYRDGAVRVPVRRTTSR